MTEQERKTERNSFFDAIPEYTRALYIHVSHRFNRHNHLIEGIEAQYGIDNILITHAPATSGQSFSHIDERIEAEKREMLERPVAEFHAQRSIDAIIYFCNSVCDGYQSPIFPQDVETNLHIWHAIRLAEQHKIQLIVAYQDRHCFSAECYEREYIANPEKIKCPATVIQV
jgi:hypothetical protein